MKIAINACFGGFGLSPKAIARLAELRGQTAYFFDGDDSPITAEEAATQFFVAYSTPTPRQKRHLKDNPENRADPLLIQVIEELGDEASARFADLKIVEIPDDVEYTIEDYDGLESIHEKHRTWR